MLRIRGTLQILRRLAGIRRPNPTGQAHSFDQDHVGHSQRREADKDDLDYTRIERGILQENPGGR